MSDIIGGAALLAPLLMAVAAAAAVAAVGAAILGVAVVGTAGVVGRVGQGAAKGAIAVGKGVAQGTIAVGQELASMAAQSAAIRRALRNSACDYEQGLAAARAAAQARAAGRAAARVAEWQEQLQLQREALSQWRTVDVSKAAEPVDLAALAAVAGMVDISSALQPGLLPAPLPTQRVERVQQYAEALKQSFDAFLERGGDNLYDCTYLGGLLQSRISALEELRSKALLDEADPAQLQSIRNDLRFFQVRLEEMNAGAARVAEQRQVALQAIEDAGERLAKLLLEADPSVPGAIAGLDIGRDALQDAEQAFAERRFEGARAFAESSLVRLQEIHSDINSVRRKNLDTLLNTYENTLTPVADLVHADLQAETGYSQDLRDSLQAAGGEAGILLEKLAEIRRRAAVDESGENLAALVGESDDLASQAEKLIEDTGKLLAQCGLESSAQCAKRALTEMGYELAGEELAQTKFVVSGVKGRRAFHVSLDDSGQVRLDLKGFGDASCQKEADDFLRRMEAQGVRGLWHREFHPSAATETMLDVLHEQGYTVKVEPADDGVTLVAVRGREMVRSSVDMDGQPHGPASLTDAFWKKQSGTAEQKDSVLDAARYEEWAAQMRKHEALEKERRQKRIAIGAGIW